MNADRLTRMAVPESPVTQIKLPPTRCPVCHRPATHDMTLTMNPPIYVYSCGCRVQYVPDTERRARGKKP